jgi:hypothetical protein
MKKHQKPIPADSSLPNKNKFDKAKNTLAKKEFWAYAYIPFQVCFI